jgi:hypothetical protein
VLDDLDDGAMRAAEAVRIFATSGDIGKKPRLPTARSGCRVTETTFCTEPASLAARPARPPGPAGDDTLAATAA